MGVTRISWTHYSFNCWRGCARVSEGCRLCYAERWAKRNPAVFGTWGPEGQRVIASESYWRKPLKWNRDAEKAGERRRVFCGSMMDVFEDKPELERPRARVFDLIAECHGLDWLLLTKRPESIEPILRRLYAKPGKLWEDQEHWHDPVSLPNVWLGATVENQDATPRIADLVKIPAARRFLSLEPMLGPIGYNFGPVGAETCHRGEAHRTGRCECRPGIDWVIVGGESGPGCRPFKWDWARSIHDQCQAAGVAFWMKQGGGHPSKRERLEDLPPDLRIRELPS